MSTLRMKQGFTLVEIMIVASIIALLAVLAIPNLQHERMKANDALAKTTLRIISTAAESYYRDHNENYPVNEASLIGTYLDKAYCTNSPIAGYIYNCRMSPSGYTITATPVAAGSTGTTTETITTGSVLTP